MRPKNKCQLRPNDSSFFLFFHETEWIYKVLRILNLEGQQNYIIGSKVTTILSPFFFRKFKTSNISIWGVYPEAID